MDILLVANRLAKVDVTKALIKILNKKSIQRFITDLNTEVQLFDNGEDSEGTQLSAIGGIYAVSTIKLSRTPKKNRSHINLKDTGDFYKTFDVVVNNNASFRIEADTIKGGVNLEKRWGDKIVGLQEENVTLVLDRLRDEFYKAIYRGL
tara:strand:+ start:194 stop:640 length:447 start_codon:yes stop_codon:yes gene_type:complete